MDQATSQGIDGWVRNRSDGTVEAVLSGDDARVQALIERCHEGPRLARVTSIEAEPQSERPQPGFVQLPTL